MLELILTAVIENLSIDWLFTLTALILVVFIVCAPCGSSADVMNRRWQHKNYNPPCVGFGSSSGSSPINVPSSLSIAPPPRSRPVHAMPTSHTLPQGGDIMSHICEISEGLYLCGARAIKVSKLRDLGITTIVNATVELPNLPFDTIDYVKVCIEDSPFANLSYYFDRIADKIEEVRRRGGNTLVHCVAGISRSASLCIAYMMKYKRMPLRKAYQHVKARRHIIRPNPGFFRQLIEYEARLLGTNTVSMVWNQAAGGHIPDLYEHEYSNTLSYMAKYGNGGGSGGHHHHHGHGHHRSGAGSSSSSSKLVAGPPTSGLLGSSIGGRGDAGSGWSHLHSSSAYRRL